MANLFWGVSDALDLYGEYMHAKNQQTSKKLAQKIKNSNEDNEENNIKGNDDIVDENNSFNPNTVDTDSIDLEKKNESSENVDKIADSHNKSDDRDVSAPLKQKAEVSEGSGNEQEILKETPNGSTDCFENNKEINESNSENMKTDIENSGDSKENAEYFKKLAIEIANDSCLKIDELDEVRKNQSKDEKTIDNEDLGVKTEEEYIGVQNTPREDPEPCEVHSPQQVLNILIYGGGDPRHIIKTIAKRYTHCEDEGTPLTLPILKFYIVDGCMEIVARNIVLLGIALECPELISLRNKVHLFMDVYGNSLLRPICHQYLISKSTTLLKMVSDSDTLATIAPFIHIDELKYREIDALQDAFEFWQPKPGYDFNIKDYWMGRIRKLLAVRYDAREGVFDWDLNMSLKDRGAEQICSQEYRYWRETGIAFTYPEYEQCKPNKTLAAGLVRNGGRYLHRGYIGDIQTGPFCTFGLRSAEERMHHSAHGENDYRATDVTERNLLEYFHEIQNGTPYVHNKALLNKYGSVRFQMGERLIHNEFDMKDICAYDKPWINVEGIEVHFIPLNDVHEIGNGQQKWKEFFDIAFIGYKYFDFISSSFPSVLRENSLIIFETNLRSVEIKTRIVEFENELRAYAKEANFLNVLNYNALNSKNSILKFWKPEKLV